MSVGAGMFLKMRREDKEKKEKGTYTRRDFLKTAGLGATALGLFGTSLYRADSRARLTLPPNTKIRVG